MTMKSHSKGLGGGVTNLTIDRNNIPSKNGEFWIWIVVSGYLIEQLIYQSISLLMLLWQMYQFYLWTVSSQICEKSENCSETTLWSMLLP
jgi:hypothetical protein